MFLALIYTSLIAVDNYRKLVLMMSLRFTLNIIIIAEVWVLLTAVFNFVGSYFQRIFVCAGHIRHFKCEDA